MPLPWGFRPMPAAPDERSSERLAAALAEPAVLVDGGGLVVAWNAAAAARLGIAGDAVRGAAAATLLGEHARTARRLALADPELGALLVWPPEGDGLGPDAIALEKLALIERISGPVSHEVKNAIGPQRGFADLALGDPGLPDDLRPLARNAVEAGDLATELAVAMFEFSRAASTLPSGLGQIARGIVGLLKAPMLNMETRVAVSDDLPPVEADPATVRHVLLAIVVNALEAQGTRWARGGDESAAGRLAVSARHLDDTRGNRVWIAVEDGAAPVAEPERRQLFTAPGLGRATRDLAVAQVLVRRAGGRLSHVPLPSGNRIVIELPVIGAAPLAELGPDAEPVAEPAPLVLVCDPMPLVRTLLVRFMERSGARAVEARDGREAVEILGREPVAMVVADVGTDADGFELYDAAVGARPDLAARFVALSADPGSQAAAAFTSRTGIAVLGKPFDTVRVEQLVRDALGI